MARQIISDFDLMAKIPFSLAAGWSNFSVSYPCVYWREGNRVNMEGLATTAGATALGVLVGTLPVNFRPVGQAEIYTPVTISSSGNQAPGGVYVSSATGEIHLQQPTLAAAGWVSLANISFRCVA